MRFRSPFRGCLYICGHDKSAPTAANRLPIMLRTDCNNVANIPQNTHEIFRKMSTFTHETPTNHSVRRRGRFIAPVSLHYQIYIFRFTKYAFSFHHTRIFTLSNMRFHSPFCGCLYIRGHDKSAPTAADGLPIMLQTFHNNATFTLLFWGKYKKGPHKWNPFNCKPSAITITNRLQQCHKHPRSIVFLQSTRALGALWF